MTDMLQALNKTDVLKLEDMSAYLRDIPYVTEADARRCMSSGAIKNHLYLEGWRPGMGVLRVLPTGNVARTYRLVRWCNGLDEVMTHVEAATIGCGPAVHAVLRVLCAKREKFLLVTADPGSTLAFYSRGDIRSHIVYMLESALYQHRAIEHTFGKVLTGCASVSLSVFRDTVTFDKFDNVVCINRFTDPRLGEVERNLMVDRILSEHFDPEEAQQIREDLVQHVAPYGLLSDTSANLA